MNKIALLLASLMLALSISVEAQLQEPIKVEKRFGTVFTQNGKVLKPRQLLEITHNNPEAFKSMQLAKKNYDAGAVFSFVGGFMVGWPCGTALAGGDPGMGSCGCWCRLNCHFDTLFHSLCKTYKKCSFALQRWPDKR